MPTGANRRHRSAERTPYVMVTARVTMFLTLDWGSPTYTALPEGGCQAATDCRVIATFTFNGTPIAPQSHGCLNTVARLATRTTRAGAVKRHELHRAGKEEVAGTEKWNPHQGKGLRRVVRP